MDYSFRGSKVVSFKRTLNGQNSEEVDPVEH